MERTREEIQSLRSFIKFLASHYKDEFANEFEDLRCAVEEIDIKEEEPDSYWYNLSMYLQKENEMLRNDLKSLSDEFKNQNNG